MKKILTGLFAAAAIAGMLVASVTDASAQRRGRWVAPLVGGIVGGLALSAILSSRPQGYVVYRDYGEPVYGEGCYWAAEPVYDRRGRVIGYTGEPVQVCPGY